MYRYRYDDTVLMYSMYHTVLYHRVLGRTTGMEYTGISGTSMAALFTKRYDNLYSVLAVYE